MNRVPSSKAHLVAKCGACKAVIPVAASEKKKRGRPRAEYSFLAKGRTFPDGSVLDEDSELEGYSHRTRRGRLDGVLANRAGHLLESHWRPEWAWFWYAKPGEIVPERVEREDFSRMAIVWATDTLPLCIAEGGARRVRLGVLTEIGRIDYEQGEDEALAWAAALAALPMKANTKRLIATLRDHRLGRDSKRLDVGVLRVKLAKVIDRHLGPLDPKALEVAARALDETREIIDHLSGAEHVALHEPQDEPEQIRIAIDEYRVRIAEEELLEHEEATTQPAAAAKGAA